MSKKKAEAKVPTLDEFQTLLRSIDPEFLKAGVVDCLPDYNDVPSYYGDLPPFDPSDPLFVSQVGDPVKFAELSDEDKIEVYAELMDAEARLVGPWEKHQEQQYAAFLEDKKVREKMSERILVAISGISLSIKNDGRGVENRISGKITFDFTPSRAGSFSAMLGETLLVDFSDPETGEALSTVEMILLNAQSKFVGGVHKLCCGFKMTPGAGGVPAMMEVDGSTLLADIAAKQVEFNDFAKPFNRYNLNL